MAARGAAPTPVRRAIDVRTRRMWAVIIQRFSLLIHARLSRYSRPSLLLSCSPSVISMAFISGMPRADPARLAALAAERRLAPMVLTFEPHPREFFAPDSAPARLDYRS